MQARDDTAAKAPQTLEGRTFFLGLGAHKAGTTWLHEYLVRHPEVALSPLKEMHFFGWREADPSGWPLSMFRRRLERREAEARAAGRPARFRRLRQRIAMGGDIAAYQAFFAEIVGEKPVFGEITPAYAILPAEEFAFIRSHFPRLRALYILRNPADRHWSHMRFDGAASGGAALAARIEATLANPRYRERADYCRTLDTIEAALRPEERHVEFFEGLFTPEAVRRICAFLGIAPLPAPLSERANAAPPASLPRAARARLVRALAPQYHGVAERLGAVPESWRADMEEFL